MENLNHSGEQQGDVDDANPIILLRNPQKFRQTFFQLTQNASKSLKAQQFDRSLKILNKCIEMLDLGKNILKDISKYWKLCIFANFACVYQGSWKMQKCHKYCEKVEEQLQELLQAASTKQSFLNITKHVIRIKFQHCAILSQLNQHQKALEMCKSTLPSLQKYIKSILQYAQELTAHQIQRKSSQTVHFSRHVCSFAGEILKNLLKSLSEPLNLSIDKSSFYYWQKNPENNEEQVKKKFVSSKTGDNCKRSILGVNKMAHWIDEFNIGTIMHMGELSVKDFEQTLPIEEYIFKDKLYETVIHCSVAHFTIATEMRFIESNKDRDSQEGDEQNNGHLAPNLVSIRKKYGYEEKSEMFRLSELYHLRAINIMAENIKTTVPYISHLIKSYDKHYIYKKQLQPVLAIPQQSQISLSQANIMRSPSNNPPHKETQVNSYYTPFCQQNPKHQNNKILHDLSQDEIEQAQISQKQKRCSVELKAPHLPQLKKVARNKSIGKLKSGRDTTKKHKKGEKKEKEKKKGNSTKQSKEEQLRKYTSCGNLKNLGSTGAPGTTKKKK